MLNKFARLILVPVLAALALAGPAAVAPKSASAVKAEDVRYSGPYANRALADRAAAAFRRAGFLTEVYADDSGLWFVKATRP